MSTNASFNGGVGSIDDHEDVDTSTAAPVIGDQLEWDGTNWVPATPSGGVVTHASTTGQTPDDHHDEAHTVASHSDTTATGLELETLTDGSNADLLHSHAAPTIAHADTTGQGPDDHHNEAHTVASHSDTSATGPELDTLTDGSNADALHTHAGGALPDFLLFDDLSIVFNNAGGFMFP